MYSVYAKNGDETICIYNDTHIVEKRKSQSPKLDLIEGNAGTFSIKLPSTNEGYDFVEQLVTEIIVQKRGEEIWSGRIISIKEDFYKNKTLTCEGELAYLNDSIQPQEFYEGITVYQFLQILINVHNDKVSQNQQFDKKFTLGEISGAVKYITIDEIYTNYEVTLKVIADKIVNVYGGFLKVTKQDGVRYLNYLQDSDRTLTKQEIIFGNNLLDFTKSYDVNDFCTVVLPLGKRIEDQYGISASGIDGVEAYTTVESVNGDVYVKNDEGVNNFGWIEKVVKWDDEENPELLLEKAEEYLKETQFAKMTLEVKAIDLSYLQLGYNDIKLSEVIRVISKVHGLDKNFPVTKISIPLDNPANTAFSMGIDVSLSLSERGNDNTKKLSDEIQKIPPQTDVLEKAKKRAADLINSFTTGYITITTDENGSNELFVTNTKITTKEEALTKASKYWRWNLHGLGFFNKDDPKYNNVDNLVLALTMDGEIVADFITAGTLNANVLRAGIITSTASTDTYWDLNRGILHLSTSTQYGNTTLSSKFQVTDEAISSEVSRAQKVEGNLGTRVTNLNTKIEQTAESITQKAAATYQTISNAKTSVEQLESKIEQTAKSITQTVGSTIDTYDTRDYTIAIYDFGSPNYTTYPPSNYSGRYYLNQSNGYLYRSTGSSWSYVTVLTKNSTAMYSEIKQTKEGLDLTVKEGEISSKLSIEKDKINLESGRLIIKTGNFQIDENGTITAVNADLSGKLTIGGTSGSKFVMYNGLLEGYYNNSYYGRIYMGQGTYTYERPSGSTFNRSWTGIDIYSSTDIKLTGDTITLDFPNIKVRHDSKVSFAEAVSSSAIYIREYGLHGNNDYYNTTFIKNLELDSEGRVTNIEYDSLYLEVESDQSIKFTNGLLTRQSIYT